MGVVAVIKTLKTLCGAHDRHLDRAHGPGVTLALGMFAWLGMPILIVGPGLLSAAVESIEGG